MLFRAHEISRTQHTRPSLRFVKFIFKGTQQGRRRLKLNHVTEPQSGAKLNLSRRICQPLYYQRVIKLGLKFANCIAINGFAACWVGAKREDVKKGAR